MTTASHSVRVGDYTVEISASGYDPEGDLSPELVFVHGWAGTRTLWDQTLATMAYGWRAAAIDMPGFGGSGPAPADVSSSGLGHVLLQIVAALSPGGVTLVGHSLGALVVLEAARLAAQRPAALVRGLVLVSPPDPADLRIRTALFRTPMSGIPVAAAFQAVGRVAARVREPSGHGRAARWVRRRAHSVGTPTKVLYAVAHELAHAPSPEPLVGGLPVLVVIGDSDHTVSADAGRRVAGSSAEAELVVLPRAGHHVMEAQPELFASALHDWLARTMGTGPTGPAFRR